MRSNYSYPILSMNNVKLLLDQFIISLLRLPAIPIAVMYLLSITLSRSTEACVNAFRNPLEPARWYSIFIYPLITYLSIFKVTMCPSTLFICSDLHQLQNISIIVCVVYCRLLDCCLRISFNGVR